MKKLAKPIVLIYFLIFGVNYLHSQIKLYPNLGIAKPYNQMLDNNTYLDTYKGDSKGLKDELLEIYLGFEIMKKVNKHNFSFKYGFTYLSLAAIAYSDPSKRNLYSAGFNIIGTGQNLFGLFYSRDFEFSLNRYCKSKNPNTIKPNKSITLCPYLGINTNHIQWRVNWSNVIEIQNDSIPNDIEYGWDLADDDNKYKAVKNRNGLSVETGVRFTYKTNKEKISVLFIYNQGITNYLESKYTKYISKIDKTVSSRFSTNGSFVSICVSYPITIINPKGERYRDRHSK